MQFNSQRAQMKPQIDQQKIVAKCIDKVQIL